MSFATAQAESQVIPPLNRPQTIDRWEGSHAVLKALVFTVPMGADVILHLEVLAHLNAGVLCKCKVFCTGDSHH